MSWLRGSLFAALLGLPVTLASADTITVTTTTDDNVANSLCSLREAVEYFNLHRKPEEGYQGCVATGSPSNTITLASDAAHPYVLDSPVFIHQSLSVVGAGSSVGAVSSGTTPATIIRASGSNRAFVVHDEPLFQPPACFSSPSGCSPAGAPALSPSSDTGAADFLTTDDTPEFSGSLAAIVADSVTVRLYTTLFGTDTPVKVGDVDVPLPAASWTITARSLQDGQHRISYTTQLKTGVVSEPESTQSPATTLDVYSRPGRQLVAFSQLELVGACTAALASCAISADGRRPEAGTYTNGNGLTYFYNVAGTGAKGGVVYTDEGVSFNSVILHDGRATTGGAVYAGADGGVQFSASELRKNEADDGAAVYLERNALNVDKSLVTANTANSGAVIQVASNEEVSGISPTLVENSTFSGNSGAALSFFNTWIASGANAVVNASTIVLNGAGINFNNQAVAVYNSIIAGNPDSFPNLATSTDCLNLPASPSFRFSVSVEAGGCGTVTSADLRLLSNTATTATEKLMASMDYVDVTNELDDRCIGYVPTATDPAASRGMGLLCPLAANGGIGKTHLTRLLPTYGNASESPFITKGLNTSSGAVCPGNDQRAKTRRSPCDIGALELQAVGGSVSSGGDIRYGQTFTSASYNLGDEELMDPTVSPCPASARTLAADAGKLGCPWLEKAPARGTVVFGADGTYTYRPSSNFHGFDRFTIRVVTTVSRLNSTPDSQSRIINGQVIVEPPGGISSQSLGGALGGWELLLLGGMVTLLRRRQGWGEKMIMPGKRCVRRLLAASFLVSLPVHALTTITVTTTADEDGGNPAACSLREAVTAVNSKLAYGGCPAGARVGSNLIQLQAGTYDLTRGEITVSAALTIAGPDMQRPEEINPLTSQKPHRLRPDNTTSATIIHATPGDAAPAPDIPASRIFMATADINLRDLVLRGNFPVATPGPGTDIDALPAGDDLVRAAVPGNGGLIYAGAGVALNNVIITHSLVYSSGTKYNGGAIFLSRAGAGLTFSDVTFRYNRSNGTGGAIAMVCTEDLILAAHTISVNRVLFERNRADAGAGVIDVCGRTDMTVSTSTFSDNRSIPDAAVPTGAIAYNQTQAGTGSLSLVLVTAAEHATGPVLSVGGLSRLSLDQSVLIANSMPACQLGTPPVVPPLGNYNAIESADTSCNALLSTATGASNQQITVPLADELVALGDHGGLINGYLPKEGSLFVRDKAGLFESCSSPDQRGVSRKSGVACDIGAVERLLPTANDDIAISLPNTDRLVIIDVLANDTFGESDSGPNQYAEPAVAIDTNPNGQCEWIDSTNTQYPDYRNRLLVKSKPVIVPPATVADPEGTPTGALTPIECEYHVVAVVNGSPPPPAAPTLAASAPATASAHVKNAAPNAVNDVYVRPVGTASITINPVSNDNDDGDGKYGKPAVWADFPLYISAANEPQLGHIEGTLGRCPDFTVTSPKLCYALPVRYVADNNLAPFTDSFRYSVYDADERPSSEATVTIKTDSPPSDNQGSGSLDILCGFILALLGLRRVRKL